MKAIFYFLYLFFSIIFFFGCNKSKMQAPPPFYMNVSAVNVATISGQGTTSNKITDVWVYQDGQYKGAYPIGSTIPITLQPARLKFFAGIKKDGLSSVRIIYPFYAPIEIDTSAPINQIIKRPLTFYYKTGINFRWVEDFENFGGIGGITITKGTGSDTGVVIVDKSTNPNADVFEGNKCMKICVDNNHGYAYIISANTYQLSYDGTCLEINYKCNQYVEIGIYNAYSTKSVITLNPSYEWNKLYLDITPYLSSLLGSTSTSNSIGIYFKLYKSNDVSVGEISLDNIKLISY